MVNLLFVCEFDLPSRDLNKDLTLGDYPFRAVKLTKNADPDNNRCSGLGIGFDAVSQFSLPIDKLGKMLLFLV